MWTKIGNVWRFPVFNGDETVTLVKFDTPKSNPEKHGQWFVSGPGVEQFMPETLTEVQAKGAALVLQRRALKEALDSLS